MQQLIKTINHGKLVSDKDYIEHIIKTKKGFVLCSEDFTPCDKPYKSIEDLAKIHGKSLLK